MSLYEQWLQKAFTKEGKSIDAVWDEYLPKEQKIYEYILKEKVQSLEGTIEELSQRFNMTAEETVGFVDGINEALPEPYEVKELTEASQVKLIIDFEKLYKKMVEYRAEHLYNLPEWNQIFDEAERKRLYTEQRKSRTVVNTEKKVGRNDPCPCGSGKKYKHCCGANI